MSTVDVRNLPGLFKSKYCNVIHMVMNKERAHDFALSEMNTELLTFRT
jgi:hypothetical protein